MKKQSDFKLVRIPRKASEYLSDFINQQREKNPERPINASHFIGQSIYDRVNAQKESGK